MSDFIYSRDGDVFHPTTWAGSPWSATSQHGGPPNALFMRAAEQAAAEAGMRVARLTVDLLKPVPMQPLRLAWEFARRGRRMAIIDATLKRADDGTTVAVSRAVALMEHGTHETLFPPPDGTRAGPDTLQRHDLVSKARRETGPPGFHLSVDVRYGGGGDDGIVWFSSPLDLVAGEAITPAQACAAICDLTTVTSGRLRNAPPGVWDNTNMFPMLNVDTTLHLFRPPVGNWFGFAESFIADHHGVGVAEVMLVDERGPLGRSVQTVASNA